jgi:hypothetical protein
LGRPISLAREYVSIWQFDVGDDLAEFLDIVGVDLVSQRLKVIVSQFTADEICFFFKGL